MRAAVPALSAVAFLLISLGLFLGGRLAVPARHAPDAVPPEAGLAGTGEPPRARPGTPPDPSLSSSRLIAPAVVAPPPLDPNELQREPPRAPLSALSLPLPPKRDEPEGGRLFRPLAVESAVVEAMGRKVTIAGTRSVAADESCEFEGEPWACGMRARTAFRMWLRGRALDCDLPPDAGDEVATSCRLGKQDAGAWLVSNGWARAAPGGPYVEAEAAARAAGKGIFGGPPAALPEELGATGLSDAAASMPPVDQPAPAE
jgi:hypothetical protein